MRANPTIERLAFVSDIRRARDELQARGVEFTPCPSHHPLMIHRHTDGTEEWMAFFKDPEGRPLAIMARIGPAA